MLHNALGRPRRQGSTATELVKKSPDDENTPGSGPQFNAGPKGAAAGTPDRPTPGKASQSPCLTEARVAEVAASSCAAQR